LVDILSYSDAPNLLSLLRQEAATWLPQVGKDPAALRKVEKFDSVIRETMRFNNIAAQGLVREVVAPGGITTPDGVYLPQGPHIHSTIANMQRDPAFYGPTADKYDPFRFCIDADDSGAEVYGRKRYPSAVHLSPEYLSFGLGRHACPGRIFAVNAIKLKLGHLLLEYDVEPYKERPKMIEIGEEIMPSEEIMMKVRRKVEQEIKK
ncbi:cytochrome P450, partial [Calycina marina]